MRKQTLFSLSLIFMLILSACGGILGSEDPARPEPTRQSAPAVSNPTAMPTNEPVANCDKANKVIPATSWTDWLPAENQVCADAVKIRPEPFEAPVFDVSSVVQLATDYDDTDVRTLKYGSPWLIYEYDLPAGVRPVFQATQSDIITEVSFCWQREERDGDEGTLETQLLMRIRPHNGGSALITFVSVSPTDVPAIGQFCP